MRKSASEILRDLDSRISNLEGKSASQPLPTQVMRVFTEALSATVKDRSLSEDEMEARRDLIMSLMNDVNNVVREHQKLVSAEAQKIFASLTVVERASKARIG